MPLLLPLFVHWCPPPPSSLSLPSTRSILVLSFLPLLLLFLSFHLLSLLLLLPYSCPPSSSFISSIFFIHILHLLPPSLPSSSTEGSFLNMGATEAKFGRTLETNFNKTSSCLLVCIVKILFYFIVSTVYLLYGLI